MCERPQYITIQRVENGWVIAVDHCRHFIARDAAGVVEIIAGRLGVDAEIKRDACPAAPPQRPREGGDG